MDLTLNNAVMGVELSGIHFGTEGFMRLSYCYSDADLKLSLIHI